MRHAETLVVFRIRENGIVVKHDYGLSNAPPNTPVAEFARVHTARNIALRSASNVPRAKPAWQAMKCVLGKAGIIIKPWLFWQRGF